MKILLRLLIGTIAVTTIVYGIWMVQDPEGVVLNLQTYLLDNTPFKSFVMPGILLAIIVGGVNLVALVKNLRHSHKRFTWAIAGGTILTIWILTQMFLTGMVHWILFLYLGIGILTILLAYQLKGKWIV